MVQQVSLLVTLVTQLKQRCKPNMSISETIKLSKRLKLSTVLREFEAFIVVHCLRSLAVSFIVQVNLQLQKCSTVYSKAIST